MRRKVIYRSLLILLIAGNIFAQSSWQWSNPVPQGQNLLEVQFINNSTAYSCSTGGGVIKTSNSGANWICLSTGTKYYFASVFFLNDMTGFAGGYNNPGNVNLDKATLIKTTNGGISWNGLNTNFPVRNNIISTIYFLNTNTGFISQTDGTVNKTTDGGNLWSTQTITGAQRFNFFDDNTGFAFNGAWKIFKTTNCGTTWTTTQYNFTTEAFIDVSFIDPLNWYVGLSGGTVFKTTNAGLNWQNLYTGSPAGMIKMVFVDINTGYFINNNGINRTTNQGVNWTQSLISSSGNLLRSLCFGNATTGVATGLSGIIYRTTNGGVNWVNLLAAYNSSKMQCIFFVNDNTGFAGGGQQGNLGNAVLMKTTNKGNLWTTLGAGDNYSNTALYFSNENTGYMGTSEGKIFKTTNSGTSWQLKNSGFGSVSDILFTDQSTGYYSGSGYIYRTTNEGLNWNIINGVFGNSFSFVNSNTGYASYSNGTFYKTTNAGVSWLNMPTGYSSLGGIYFVDELTGYTTSGKYILKTSNSGVTWTTSFYNPNFGVGKIKFYDHNTGYSIGSRSLILKTTDAGQSWTEQQQPSSCELFDFSVLNGDNVFVCGEFGAILKTASGGLVNIGGNVINPPSEYLLTQNYPNPFNPTTNIKYTIPEVTGRDLSVRLKVYDVNGKEIASLVNEKQNAGSYSVEFDGSKFASGIYFYTLSAGEFIETRKMLLIK